MLLLYSQTSAFSQSGLRTWNADVCIPRGTARAHPGESRVSVRKDSEEWHQIDRLPQYSSLSRKCQSADGVGDVGGPFRGGEDECVVCHLVGIERIFKVVEYITASFNVQPDRHRADTQVQHRGGCQRIRTDSDMETSVA